MAMTAPTFADIDFGFANDNGDDFASICIAAVPGEIATRSETITFNGVDGAWSAQYGIGSMFVMLDVVTWFKSEAVKTTFEQALEAKLDLGSWSFSVHSRSYNRAVLKKMPQMGRVLPYNYPWAFGKRYMFLFEVLDPVDW